MKTIAITQARVGSTRLPRKVLMKIGEDSLLQIHLRRLKKAKLLDQIVVATTREEESDLICDIAKSENLSFYKGSTEDVLDRFYQAAKLHNPEWVVRVTSDCPLLDATLLDAVVRMAQIGDYDYYSNILVEDFPDGQDIEVFKMSALKMAWQNATSLHEREHVTPYLRNNCDFNGGKLFKAANYPSPADYNNVRMTVDEPEDLEMMRWLIKKLGTDKTWIEYTRFVLENNKRLGNTDIVRNEGYLKSINDN